MNSDVSVLPSREQINILQSIMASMPQVDLSDHTKHHFADGMYIRELFRPAGTTIVGKVHKKEHFYIQNFQDDDPDAKDEIELIKDKNLYSLVFGDGR